jgi:AcrR family transcriptional regulator
MEQVVLHQLLEKANRVLRDMGVRMLHEEQLAVALDLTPAMFRTIFGSKAEMLLQVTRHDLARQRHEHEELFANLATPVECMLGLLHHSLHELRHSNHEYHIVREQYPLVWNTIQEYTQDYAFPLLTRLIRESVQEGQFLASLDATFIARIILAQFSLVLNEQFFPPDHTNLGDVYRSIFFPYVRGLCTEEGMRLTAPHFARMWS